MLGKLDGVADVRSVGVDDVGISVGIDDGDVVLADAGERDGATVGGSVVEDADGRTVGRREGTGVGPAVGGCEVGAELGRLDAGDRDGVAVGGGVSGGSFVVVLVVELDDVDDVENGGSVHGTSATCLVGWRVGLLVDGDIVAGTTLLGTGGRTWVRFTMPPPQPQHATVLSMPEPGGESHSAKLPQVTDQPGPGAPFGRHHCSRTYSEQDVPRALTQPGTSWHCVGPIVAVVVVAVSVVVVVVAVADVAVTDVAVWVDAVEVLELVAVVDVDDAGA